jgi:hypothetical protein
MGFSKVCPENSSLIKIGQVSTVLCTKIDIHFLYIAKFILEREMFVKNLRKSKHKFFTQFSFENRTVYEIMWKNIE